MERNTSKTTNPASNADVIARPPAAKEENASWREGAVGQELVQLLEKSYPSDTDTPSK